MWFATCTTNHRLSSHGDHPRLRRRNGISSPTATNNGSIQPTADYSSRARFVHHTPQPPNFPTGVQTATCQEGGKRRSQPSRPLTQHPPLLRTVIAVGASWWRSSGPLKDEAHACPH